METRAMKMGGFLLAWFVFLSVSGADAGEPVTLASVPDEWQEIREDEKIRDHFSASEAARYLDGAALTWQKKKKCATCHTNMPYLMARPALASALPDFGEVRSFFEEYPKVRRAWRKPSEKQGFWSIVVATGLTFHDLQDTGKLSEVTREVLDVM